MKSIWVGIQVAFSALGGFLGWYLGGMDGFSCCAVAAGPAFEGAGIACGMLGVDGAVSRVRYSAGGVKVHPEAAG